MHLITITQPVNMGLQGIIPPGTYISDDIFAGSMLTKCPPETCTLLPVYNTHDFIELDRDNWKHSILNRIRLGKSLNGKRILLVRPGAFGDLLFLTPVVRHLKAIFDVQIDVCCLESYAQVFTNNPDVTKCIQYPLNMDDVRQYHAITFLDGMIERHPKQKEMHAVDIVYERVLGYIPGDCTKRMHYYVSEEESKKACKRIVDMSPTLIYDMPRIALQVKASTPSRSYPREQLNALIKLLLEKKYEVFLLGFPGEIPPINNCPPNLHNLSNAKLTFRESAAILANCQGFIGPDSAYIHVAGALGIPSVALYAAFPWENRIKYNSNFRALTGRAISPVFGDNCAPCHFHKLDVRDFPESGPCYRSGKCDALASIEPSRIVSVLEKLLETKTQNA